MLWRSGLRVVSILHCFKGGVWGAEQVQLNFSFQNKFIILFLYGLLVDNNTFSKMFVFKSLTGYTDYGGYEKPKCAFFNKNKIKSDEELVLVILNS